VIGRSYHSQLNCRLMNAAEPYHELRVLEPVLATMTLRGSKKRKKFSIIRLYGHNFHRYYASHVQTFMNIYPYINKTIF